VWRLDFFVLRDVPSQRVYPQEESLPRFLSAIELSAWLNRKTGLKRKENHLN